MDNLQCKKKLGRGEFFFTGSDTEEQIIGKCEICGQETKTKIRHRKTKMIIGTGCVSKKCKPEKDPKIARKIAALFDANKVREI